MTRSSQPKPMRSFFIVWAGQAVSLLGSTLVNFALIWHLTQQTGSATILVTAGLMNRLRFIVLGPYVGALVAGRWRTGLAFRRGLCWRGACAC